MAVYEFTLAFRGGLDEATVDALFEAGCGDITFSGNKSGLAYADVTREASSFLEAVLNAIRQIESVPGLRVEALQAGERDTMTDIADPGPIQIAPVVNAALTLRRGETGLSEPERRALLELVTA